MCGSWSHARQLFLDQVKHPSPVLLSQPPLGIQVSQQPMSMLGLLATDDKQHMQQNAINVLQKGTLTQLADSRSSSLAMTLGMVHSVHPMCLHAENKQPCSRMQ